MYLVEKLPVREKFIKLAGPKSLSVASIFPTKVRAGLFSDTERFDGVLTKTGALSFSS